MTIMDPIAREITISGDLADEPRRAAGSGRPAGPRIMVYDPQLMRQYRETLDRIAWKLIDLTMSRMLSKPLSLTDGRAA